MPTDLVVDTNVLVHANNPEELRQEYSINLINYLLSSTEVICIDEGFDFNEAVNSSYIGYEYLLNLKNGMLGYTLISILAQTKRISEISRNTSSHVTKAINQCTVNKHDRVFIKVTINSNNKVLISHDFMDFDTNKRKHLKKTFKIDVLVAEDIP